MNQIANLEAMLLRGQDSALLRYALGNAYLSEDRPTEAIPHLAEAVRREPGYSAAWKLYGKALAATGDYRTAIEVFEQGIAVAEQRGDRQAAKEMRVFQRRAKTALAR